MKRSVRLFNPSYGTYAFVSNDKKGPDHLVEAHTSGGNEDRDAFELQYSSDNNTCKIYNLAYGKHLFVSDDTDGPDHFVEAHESDGSEERDTFKIEQLSTEGKKARVLIHNPTYGVTLFVSNDKRGPDHLIEAHKSSHKSSGRENRDQWLLEPIM